MGEAAKCSFVPNSPSLVANSPTLVPNSPSPQSPPVKGEEAKTRIHSSAPSRLLPEQQIRLDKGIEVAVEHRIDVADLVIGAMVLDQPVGLEDVGADLAAP